jgi:hypothetical protein
VTVSLESVTGTTNYTAAVKNDSQWVVALGSQPASTGNRATITSSTLSNTTTLANISFGDVLLCAGQSNMDLQVIQTTNSTNEIAAASRYPNIQLFKIAAETADAPRSRVDGSGWIPSAEAASSDFLSHFSAVCYYSGRALSDGLGVQGMSARTESSAVPIGLIQASWGGTHLEAWSSAPALRECAGSGTTKCHNLSPRNDPAGHNNCSVLWNAMLAPLAPASLKAVLWYQAESNTDLGFEANASTYIAGPTNYACRIPAFVSDLRRQFAQPALPFFYVEVAACDTYPEAQIADAVWPLLRQSQRAVLRLPGTGFATAVDLGFSTGGVHSPRKQEVGRRLGLLLLREDEDGDGGVGPVGTAARSRVLSPGPPGPPGPPGGGMLGVGTGFGVGPSLASASLSHRNSTHLMVTLSFTYYDDALAPAAAAAAATTPKGTGTLKSTTDTAGTAAGLNFAGSANCTQRGSGLCCRESPFEIGFAGGTFVLAEAAVQQTTPTPTPTATLHQTLMPAAAVAAPTATVVLTLALAQLEAAGVAAAAPTTDVRYAWRAFPQCVLYGGAGAAAAGGGGGANGDGGDGGGGGGPGLPVAPFRVALAPSAGGAAGRRAEATAETAVAGEAAAEAGTRPGDGGGAAVLPVCPATSAVCALEPGVAPAASVGWWQCCSDGPVHQQRVGRDGTKALVLAVPEGEVCVHGVGCFNKGPL